MIREAVLRRIIELKDEDREEPPQGADPDPVEKGDPESEVELPRDNPPQRDDDSPPPEEQPPPEEPGEDAEDQADQNRDDAIDADGDAGQEPGRINHDLEGKSVQSISVEEDSKILPGAKEVILAFAQGTEPLRILCTPTGRVSFFWRNQMFDMP